jgi:ornithine carbamoyltransferase
MSIDRKPPRPRHFLTLLDLTETEAKHLITRASELKRMRQRGELYRPFIGYTLAMVFEKSSTRTRVSFEAGMSQLGGTAMFLSPRDTQLGRGEPIEDSARVLSRMVDVVMIRTFSHDTLTRFAEHSRVPVINGLTDRFHPCQLLADMQTFVEHRGPIRGRRVAFIGDGNNMCHSYVNAARIFGFELRIACPEAFEPDPKILATAAEHCTLVHDPAEAVEHADLVVTDVWASMGQEDEQDARKTRFSAFTVTPAIMARARAHALFMHCLPAHRGEEVSSEVIDGPQSVVWDEAENRLHAQKALLELLLGRDRDKR